ncbi:MAG TPA: 4-amino-4-deoxy-L-arabinose transferase, partial [Isosphaeraceae bacterium]|nr:4-amino-4-deoxy-L-arabinose transferase [Isosphaeraceae bacterium]
LNPRATGASNLDEFLADPAIWPLDEQDQDAELSRRAWAFARESPLRVCSLAMTKLRRYWSPGPNAAGFQNPALAAAGLVVELPVFALMALGLWRRRRDPRAWVLLAGPVLYFCAVHMIFASSMRYRIPGEVPALGLAAVGFLSLRRR